MAGTMEGLGIPLYGGYATTDNSGNTILTVNSNGSHDYTFADLAADNCIDLVVTNDTATSSGYVQGFHINMTTTAVMTGGQVNALAIDFTLSGTPGVECAAIYIYVAETGTTVATNLNLWGIIINMEDMGAAPALLGGIKIYRNITNQGSTVDSFMYFYDSDTGITDALFVHGGTNGPQYFMKTLAAACSSSMFQDIQITGAASTKSLQCSFNSTIYFIPLHAATS